MTRLSEVLQKSRTARTNNFHKFTNYKPNHVHLRIRQIPMLADKVKVSTDKSLAKAQCLPEMYKMFNCWTVSDYAQGTCIEEIATFEKCILQTQEAVAERRMLSETPKLGVDSKKPLSALQINTLLRMYPQPEYAIKITHKRGRPLLYDPFVVQYPKGYLRERSNNNKF